MNFKFPSFAQWKQIFKVLQRKEKKTLLVFFALLVTSFGFLVINFYISNTIVTPAFGGEYTEGIVGQPRFINPIYGETNDIDRTLIDLVFSGLMTYDNNGNIVTDLASSYTLSPDEKTYTFILKDNIVWHDRRPLTADDVIFTIKTIQNSDYKSPLRANWIDVNAEKLSDKSVKLTLKQSYNSFLENCTLKIIPKHIWVNILPENFTLSSYNLQPIGSGPFEFSGLSQDNSGFIQSLNLSSNRKYYNKTSFIASINVKFFEKTDDLIRSAKTRTIDGFATGTFEKIKTKQFKTYSFTLPRYFAVFFNNQKSSIFADANIRKAMTYSVNKDELVQKISTNPDSIVKVDSPILSDFYGFKEPTNLYEFDIKEADTLLDKTGFKKNADSIREKITTKKPAFQFKDYLKLGSKGPEVAQLQSCLTHLPEKKFADLLKDETNGTYGTATENAITEFQKNYFSDLKPTGETGTSTRRKLNELCVPASNNIQQLKFTLVTVNQSQLVQVANLLKNYWATVGVLVEINAVNIADLKPIIKNRSYDALLYGETLGMEPDLYPFWYSSQKQDPGLNLSLYENKDIDKLLKDARQNSDEIKKAQSLEKIQDILLKDAPALFLYNPNYIYFASIKVLGIDTKKIADPAKRFININNWFLKTKRVWK
ncbi:MAG: hypothetical protein EXS48_01710 [Candidatus Staskawiczbacteria bacterium]|nr:hypothetical protein [Candidatus Staskawiczbacteria bacterium]